MADINSPEFTLKQRTYYEPSTVVPDACIERCKKLDEKYDEALVRSTESPDSTFAVVCDSLGRWGCRASVYMTGSIIGSVEGEPPFFLRNPSCIRAGYSDLGSPSDIIKRATERGARTVPRAEIKRNR